MSSYSALQDFERAIATNRIGGSATRRYMGTFAEGMKSGLVNRRTPTAMLKLHQTQKTWRACVQCDGKRYKAVRHVTGQVTLEKCVSCKGEGQVFG